MIIKVAKLLNSSSVNGIKLCRTNRSLCFARKFLVENKVKVKMPRIHFPRRDATDFPETMKD